MALFREEVFIDVIELKLDFYGGPLFNMIGFIFKQGSLETYMHIRKTPGDEGSYQSNTSTSRRMPKVFRKPLEAR